MLKSIWERWGQPPEVPPKKIESYGLTQLVDPQDARFDIVAIHGLGGHPEESWTASNRKLWLRDFLADDVPHARVLSYGYNSAAPSSRYLVHQTFSTQAENLLHDLCHLRDVSHTRSQPVVFIAHGLGGILLKSALIRSKTSGMQESDIHSSTKGIVFFGTPHRGYGTGDTAINWAKLIEMTIITALPKSSMLLRTLHKDSEWLEMQLEQFKSISEDYHIYNFYETVKTHQIVIVPRDAAMMSDPARSDDNTNSTAIERNHLDMIRFATPEDPNYKAVVRCLRKIVGSTKTRKSWRIDVSSEPSLYDDLANSDVQSESYEIPFAMPFTQHHDFTDREEYLDQLLHLTVGQQATGSSRNPVFVTGVGGIGKTQLVREFVYRNQDRFTSIAWIDASTIQSIQTSFLAFAERIVQYYASRSTSQPPPYAAAAHLFGSDCEVDNQGRLHLDQKSPSTTLNAIKQWLGRSRNDGWLIVFDNVENFEESRPLEFLPEVLKGHVILISRQNWAYRPKEVITVNAMSEDECVRLFLRMSGADAMDSNSEDLRVVESIVRNLGYLPLAVSLASSYLLKCNLSFREYKKLLDNSGPKASSPSSASIAYDQTFSSALDITFEGLNKSSADLLRSCSYMAPDNIPLYILCYGLRFNEISERGFQEILYPLLDASLAYRPEASDAISVHRLVQEAARKHFSPPKAQEYGLAVEQVFLLISTSVARVQALESESGSIESRQFEQSALPHLLSCLHYSGSLLGDVSCFQIIDGNAWLLLGSICFRQKKLHEAKTFYDLALMDVRRSLDKPDHLPKDQLLLLRKITFGLGSVCLRRREYVEAETWFQAAMIEPAANESDRLVLGKAARKLATLYTHQNRSDEAEALDSRALAIVDDTLGTTHPNTIDVLKKVAGRYRRRGQFQKSEMLKRREVLALEELYGRHHPMTTEALQDLALDCQQQGRLNEAETLMRRVVDDNKQRLGSEHSGTLQASKKLAAILAQQGRFEDAEAMYTEVFEKEHMLLGQHHPYVCVTTGRLADLHHSWWVSSQNKSNLDTARQLYQRLLESQTIALGPDNQQLMETITKLAKVMEEGGDRDGAQALLDTWTKRLSSGANDGSSITQSQDDDVVDDDDDEQHSSESDFVS